MLLLAAKAARPVPQALVSCHTGFRSPHAGRPRWAGAGRCCCGASRWRSLSRPAARSCCRRATQTSSCIVCKFLCVMFHSILVCHNVIGMMLHTILVCHSEIGMLTKYAA